MALSDLAHRKSGGRSMSECVVCYASRTLPKSDAADLELALSNPAASITEIAEALTELGYKTTPQSTGRHVRGACLKGYAYRPRVRG